MQAPRADFFRSGACYASSMNEVIPLLPVNRQRLVVRLGGVECRILVAYSPSQAAWYATVEAPVGTPIASGRRMTTDSGLLSRRRSPIGGDIAVRALGAVSAAEPGRMPWGTTHSLVYEPFI